MLFVISAKSNPIGPNYSSEENRLRNHGSHIVVGTLKSLKMFLKMPVFKTHHSPISEI